MNINGHIFFITGGTGFIGSILIDKLLNKGAVIHVLSRTGRSRRRLKKIENKIKFILLIRKKPI